MALSYTMLDTVLITMRWGMTLTPSHHKNILLLIGCYTYWDSTPHYNYHYHYNKVPR